MRFLRLFRATPRVTLDDLVARGRAANADFAARRSQQLTPARRAHIENLLAGHVRPRAPRTHARKDIDHG